VKPARFACFDFGVENVGFSKFKRVRVA